MKYTKLSLRIWLALTSVAGFLGGWMLLAHSPKPAQAAQSQPVVQITPLPTIAPLQSFQGRNFQQQAPAFSQPSTGFFPRMRTGGS